MNLKDGSSSILHYEGFQSFMYPCLHIPSKATLLPSNQETKSISLFLEFGLALAPTLANRMQRPFFPDPNAWASFVKISYQVICIFTKTLESVRQLLQKCLLRFWLGLCWSIWEKLSSQQKWVSQTMSMVYHSIFILLLQMTSIVKVLAILMKFIPKLLVVI